MVSEADEDDKLRRWERYHRCAARARAYPVPALTGAPETHMTTIQSNAAAHYISSGGHTLAGSSWLDSHFYSCEPEYASMLRSVGFQPGAQVLDAGCGSGSYLRLLSEQVGVSGAVFALDISAEHVESANNKVAAWKADGRIAEAMRFTVTQGSVLSLPYPDETMDGVWCCGVIQYLTEADAQQCLRELCRVAKKGSPIAVKDFVLPHLRLGPASPLLYWRLVDAAVRKNETFTISTLRTSNHARLLEQCGLNAVRQCTTLVERRLPLRPIERLHVTRMLAYLLEQAESLQVGDEDMKEWREICEPTSIRYLLDHPDFYWCEGHMLAVGNV